MAATICWRVSSNCLVLLLVIDPCIWAALGFSLGHLVNLLHGNVFLNKLCSNDFPKLVKQKTCPHTGKFGKFHKYNAAPLALQAIQIGGGNLYDKAASFQFLASRCQWFVFVGMMPFQVMHALGVSVPRNLVDHKAFNEALDTVRLTRDRNMQILYILLGYPFEINWNRIYSDPAQSLVVDIGSGNGLFLLEMARREQDLNFLGLEINEKVPYLYCIATNATSTFHSIVSSYPGELVLVSIQCPNPDFNKPEHRWRMLQRSLIEAVVDLLAPNGKSDWERHVLERGAPMYRIII
ncbi:tRNA (guanine-N(7)-)-methyltransferase [Glycine soja]|uniref:tRNA (Guanine-N(7)-)-methyltransferase n=1 Tax=Glycine soja TaxID=3848 RepID=A0A0B2QW58_GLYSO|nr:tRNA (guanine-N(7)-)-methyltransferase [Glycine soja]